MIRVPVTRKVLCCKEPNVAVLGRYTIKWQVCMNGEITANNSTRKTIMNKACDKAPRGKPQKYFLSLSNQVTSLKMKI